MKIALPFVFELDAENPHVAVGLARAKAIRLLPALVVGKEPMNLEERSVERMPSNRV